MSALDDPFEVLALEEESEAFAALSQKAVSPPQPASLPGAATARLEAFDLDEQPLVADVPGLPQEVVRARTTVPLRGEHIGSTVVVVFDQGDLRRPIVVGVLQAHRAAAPADGRLVAVQADDDRIELSAEREIVLRCGDASITLTRGGKVLIRGKYVLSHSAGSNRIKGAVVDIN